MCAHTCLMAAERPDGHPANKHTYSVLLPPSTVYCSLFQPNNSSDFTCLKEEHYYYGYGSPTNFFASQNTVASCDWTLNWLRADKSDTGNQGPQGALDRANCETGDSDLYSSNCGWQTVYGGRTYKVGTATGELLGRSTSKHCCLWVIALVPDGVAGRPRHACM